MDDNKEVRQSLRLLLGIDDHKVTEAESGRQALELFSRTEYDLVITDYLMPAMLGDELARNIKRLNPQQRVLIITAYAENFSPATTPADCILAKPVAIEDLREAISEWFQEA